LQGIGYTSGIGLLNKITPVKKIPGAALSGMAPKIGFAYVGSADESGTSGIHIFEIRGDQWQWTQSIPSRSPISLSLHPNQQSLYVVNEVDEHEGLPRGTVEAYRIDAHDGSLALINRQLLSLSGIKPRHAAVSPDGNYLVVAIHGGGAYNVLPIAPDGAVQRVSQILKEVGAGTHPVYQASAHPHTVAFDATGQYLLATDAGCDRVNLFTFQNGRMIRSLQTHSQPVSGPGHLAMHPSRKFFYVSNTLDGSLDCYRCCADEGEINHEQQIVMHRKTAADEAQHLVISSSGRNLYASSDQGISVWEIDPITGKLSAIQQWSMQNRSLHTLMLSPDHEHLLVADSSQHELLSIPVHAESGKLGAPSIVANAIQSTSLAVKYI
jgi:6-phosphogluconolactonase (cycloisomerase 2 family)